MGILWALLLCLGLGCGDGEASNVGATPKRPPPVESPVTFWFEPLIARPLVPPLATQLVPLPGDDGFLILGRDGDLFRYSRPLEELPRSEGVIADRTPLPAPTVVRAKLPDVFGHSDVGAQGLALDPNFVATRFFYVWHTRGKTDSELSLSRYRLEPSVRETLESRKVVLSFSRCEAPAPHHMGGIVKFLRDGTLLIGTGDAERPALAQDPSNLNGKLLRIRIREDGGYEVPPDNPFVGDARYRPEIVARGLRAPFRGLVTEDGALMFADVGARFEEINLWRPGRVDFGWGRGSAGALTDGPEVDPGVTAPLIYWGKTAPLCQDDPEYNGELRLSGAVGIIYPKTSPDRYFASLTNKLLFYDILQGWMRTADLENSESLGSHRHVAHLQFVTDMVVGRDGYVYVVTYKGDGREGGTVRTLYRMRALRDGHSP